MMRSFAADALETPPKGIAIQNHSNDALSEQKRAFVILDIVPCLLRNKVVPNKVYHASGSGKAGLTGSGFALRNSKSISMLEKEKYMLKGYFDFDRSVQVTLTMRSLCYTELLEAVQSAITDPSRTGHQGRVAVDLYYAKHTQPKEIHDDRGLSNAFRDFNILEWIQNNPTRLFNTATKRSVWIMGTPLSLLRPIEGIKRISEGNFSINHWSALITERGDDEKEPIFRIRAKLSDRHKKSRNSLKYISPFTLREFEKKCSMAGFRYAGCTTKSEEEIRRIARQLIDDYPIYDLRNNNCQNFVHRFVREICDQGISDEIPKTIQQVLKREHLSWLSDSTCRIPGTYPLSRSTSKSGSYITAFSSSLHTAPDESEPLHVSLPVSDRLSRLESQATVKPNSKLFDPSYAQEVRDELEDYGREELGDGKTQQKWYCLKCEHEEKSTMPSDSWSLIYRKEAKFNCQQIHRWAIDLDVGCSAHDGFYDESDSCPYCRKEIESGMVIPMTTRNMQLNDITDDY